MGVLLSTFIDMYGDRVIAGNAAARLKESGLVAKIADNDYPVHVSGTMSRIILAVQAETEKAAQAKLQAAYFLLNKGPLPYDVIKTGLVDKNGYRNVI